ncbi:MAG: ligase-associated DNA damage response DEXH box helicase [Hyphomicrobium sp.]|uniref:ligase-associated DNA damage response DEXH box helicase n=1 Tax=Hyphomicrobium sp. TaxID=82 RepID=UPI0013285E54|nr:ligase-associated DNA damage response DEXH box helicase [Hyphomicrobium sp.]KAB2941370.1 MAG: ligase-associated DNA damage response DEXH box helicase [Hyphomicrobium sp.]MBZ0212019.1 ligase-associated DNA damage response DEXH box helicase [Hyphomicrobium sp.]MCZ7595912.1 ligase-associated DNA damage response DEXH box helicase [Hyphomicrobium sp.]
MRIAKPDPTATVRHLREPAQTPIAAALPEPFAAWFAARGWSPRAHQLALIEAANQRRSTLLIAPTGAGKTLAGFLPSLLSLAQRRRANRGRGRGLHTLYISPLKALAVDVARNLTAPVSEMQLPIRTETRTGDTSVARRARQRRSPPDILMTTPEQLTLLLSHADSAALLADLDTVILDEVHALAATKRGDLLALDLARLRTLAPGLRAVGLSATVARPSELRAYLVPQAAPQSRIEMADLVLVGGGAKPHIDILELDETMPAVGHTTRYAIGEIYAAIDAHRLSLLFVNTRMQAELLFRDLWRINDLGLPIGLHHGSLDATQRRKVEAAMAAGSLRAVVATSTLDLGIDWGDVDLVIHVGAPKGASRFIQRIGRANHRLDEPSQAILVPSNRFEVLECRAAVDAAEVGAQDVTFSRQGALDVLAQHILGTACTGAFDPAALYAEVTSAAPYAALTRPAFDRVLGFVADGGYALKSYERYAKLKATPDGRLRIAHPRFVQAYRMNAGTIVAAPLIKVRLVGRRTAATRKALTGGRVMGEVDEYFIEQLRPGDAFVLAGEVLRFEGMSESEAFVTRATARDPIIPSYNSGKFPLSTHLAERVRAMLADAHEWSRLPPSVAYWLERQREQSAIPGCDEVLIETFARRNCHYLVAYPFEGRLAHQTLGMLLTRRLDRMGARPLGFVANDYGMALWGLGDLSALIAAGKLELDKLFAQDMLGDDLDAWLAESNLMKRTFRQVALIAGLVERRNPGREKTGRQIALSTNLIYDVLRRHDPHHSLLEAAWADAATGLLDIARLGDFLRRVEGRIVHQPLDRVSPLSVPILLEIGREAVAGFAREELLREAAAEPRLRETLEETQCSS